MDGRTNGRWTDGLFVCPSLWSDRRIEGRRDKLFFPRLQTLAYTRQIKTFIDTYKMVGRRTDRRIYFHIGMYIVGQTDGRTDTQTDIRPTGGQKYLNL